MLIWLLLKSYHFVDPALYNEVKDQTSLDAIRVASELGRFDLASMFLGGISILLGIAAIFGFVEVRTRSAERAEATARQIVDEKVGTLFNEAMKARGADFGPGVRITEAAEADVLAKAHELGK